MAVAPNKIVTPQAIITGTGTTFGPIPANANYDVPTSTAPVLAARAGGARLTRVWACLGSGARVASDCQLYGVKAGVFRLLRVLAVPLLNVPANNVLAIDPLDFGFSDSFPLFLAPGEALAMAVSVAQAALLVRAEGGAYWDATMPTPAQSNSIITPQAPITGACKLGAAGVGDYTTPGNTVALLAGQPNGARITKIQAVPAATTVTSDCELYAFDGVNNRHIRSIAVPVVAIAAGNLAAIPPLDFGFSEANPLYLGPNEGLNVAVSKAQTALIVRCEGGAY
jgi:hypothetical protein